MCARVEVISTLAVYLRDRPLYIFLFQLDAYLSPRLLLLEKIFWSLEVDKNKLWGESKNLNNITDSVWVRCVGAGSGVGRRNP